MQGRVLPLLPPLARPEVVRAEPANGGLRQAPNLRQARTGHWDLDARAHQSWRPGPAAATRYPPVTCRGRKPLSTLLPHGTKPPPAGASLVLPWALPDPRMSRCRRGPCIAVYGDSTRLAASVTILSQPLPSPVANSAEDSLSVGATKWQSPRQNPCPPGPRSTPLSLIP